MGRDARIGAEGDLDPAPVGAPRHVQHLGSGFQRLGALGRGEEVVRPGGDAGHEVPRQQGRHQPGAVRLEQADGFVVQIGAVLDRIAARLEEGVDAVCAVGVGRDLAAHAVRHLDDGGQLVLGELLIQAGGGVRQDAARGGDLDDVGARAHLGPHRAAAVLGSRADALVRQDVQDVVAIAVGVAVAAVDRDRRPRRDDARPRHVAAPHRVAQGEDGLIGPAEVGHGGEAGVERAPGVAGPDHGLVGVGHRHPVQTAVRALLAAEMDVAVDQSGQNEGVAQIDDLALPDETVADFRDLVPSDHESFIAQHPTAGRIGQKPPHLNEPRRLLGGNRRGRRGLTRLSGGGGQNGDGHNQGKFFHVSLPELRIAT
ncbi:hypothetical protein D3C73_556420 [compost metagenome]